MRLHRDIERLALLGWRLHPSSRYSRAACIKDAAREATVDLQTLEMWAWQFPGCNWRVTMAGSGIWALDVDVPGPDHAADGVTELRRLCALNDDLPRGPITLSGGGGRAIFFSHYGEPIVGRTGTPGPGLDPLRGPLSVTVPPSTHHRTGRHYRWIAAPWELAPPPAPEWLLRLVAPPPEPPAPERPAARPDTPDRRRKYALAALRHAADRVSIAPPGSRNDTLSRETWSISRFVSDGDLDAVEIAEAMAWSASQAGLDRLEIRATIRSAMRAPRRAA